MLDVRWATALLHCLRQGAEVLVDEEAEWRWPPSGGFHERAANSGQTAICFRRCPKCSSETPLQHDFAVLTVLPLGTRKQHPKI